MVANPPHFFSHFPSSNLSNDISGNTEYFNKKLYFLDDGVKRPKEGSVMRYPGENTLYLVLNLRSVDDLYNDSSIDIVEDVDGIQVGINANNAIHASESEVEWFKNNYKGLYSDKIITPKTKSFNDASYNTSETNIKVISSEEDIDAALDEPVKKYASPTLSSKLNALFSE